jgi:hypothetical protein
MKIHILYLLVCLCFVSVASGDICVDFYRGPVSNFNQTQDSDSRFIKRYIMPTIWLDVNISSPYPDEVPSDLFVSHWTGFFRPLLDGLYRFKIISDDSMSFYLNGSSQPSLTVGAAFGLSIPPELPFVNRTQWFELYANTSYPFEIQHQELRSFTALEVGLEAMDLLNSTAILPYHLLNASEIEACTTPTPAESTVTQVPRLSLSEELSVLDPIVEAPGWCASYLLSYDSWGNLPASSGLTTYPTNVANYVASQLESSINITLPHRITVPPMSNASAAYPGFTAQWQAFLIPPVTANYTFWFWGSSWFRFAINRMLIINQPLRPGEATGRTEYTAAPVTLFAGVPYLLRVDTADYQTQPDSIAIDPIDYPHIKGTPHDFGKLWIWGDWRYAQPNAPLSARERIPTVHVRTISCPISDYQNALVIRTNITGDRNLQSGVFVVPSTGVIFTGNLSLVNTTIIVYGATNISGSITLDGTSSIILNGSGAVYTQGNVIFSSGSVVQAKNVSLASSNSSSLPLISINGSALIRNGSILQIDFTSGSTIGNSTGPITIVLLTFSSSTQNTSTTPFIVQTSGLTTSRPCEQLQIRQVREAKQLALLVSVDSSQCPNDVEASTGFPLWALGIIIPGVLLCAVYVALEYYCRRKVSTDAAALRLRNLTAGNSNL